MRGGEQKRVRRVGLADLCLLSRRGDVVGLAFLWTSCDAQRWTPASEWCRIVRHLSLWRRCAWPRMWDRGLWNHDEPCGEVVGNVRVGIRSVLRVIEVVGWMEALVDSVSIRQVMRSG